MKQWGPLVLSGVGILLMALPNIANSDGSLVAGPIHTDKVAAFWAGVVCLGVSTFILRRRKASNEELTRQLAVSRASERRSREAIRQLVSAQLTPLLGRLSLTSSERISLFVRQGNQLVLVGRRSPWTILEERSGEPLPLEFGCAGEAWREKVAYGVTATDATADLERYAIEQNERWNISIDEARALGMKSRTYVGVRVDSSNPVSKPLGVLIVESTRTPESVAAPQILNPPILGRDEVLAKVREILPTMKAALDALESGDNPDPNTSDRRHSS